MNTNSDTEPLAIVRLLSGDASDEEKIEIERWANISEKNRRQLDELVSLWELTERVKSVSSIQVTRDWEKIRGTITTIKETAVSKSRPRQRSRTHYTVRIAAVLAIILVGYFSYRFISPRFTKPIIVTTSTDKSEIILPDGTKVFLNKNTSLAYPEGFSGQNRKVKLHGEAFFEVSEDVTRPFLIESENSITEVVGTSFNVNDSDPNEVIVTVSTGKVLFYPASYHNEKRILLPGEQGRLEGGRDLFKQINEDTNFLAWKTGVLSFRNTTLPKVVSDLNRYYGQNIKLKESLNHCTVTSTFKAQSLDDILAELQLVLSIQIEKRDTEIVITGTGCTQ